MLAQSAMQSLNEGFVLTDMGLMLGPLRELSQAILKVEPERTKVVPSEPGQDVVGPLALVLGFVFGPGVATGRRVLIEAGADVDALNVGWIFSAEVVVAAVGAAAVVPPEVAVVIVVAIVALFVAVVVSILEIVEGFDVVVGTGLGVGFAALCNPNIKPRPRPSASASTMKIAKASRTKKGFLLKPQILPSLGLGGRTFSLPTESEEAEDNEEEDRSRPPSFSSSHSISPGWTACSPAPRCACSEP
jgi:hypothetical protein